MTCDTWWGVNILSKFQLPALAVWDRQCLEDSEQKDHSMNESVTKVFVEQPRLYRVW